MKQIDMKQVEEIADKYMKDMNEEFINYGGLDALEEVQIRDAVLFGIKQGRLLSTQNTSGNSLNPYEVYLEAQKAHNYSSFRCVWDELINDYRQK